MDNGDPVGSVRLRRWSLVALAVVVLWSAVAPAGAAVPARDAPAPAAGAALGVDDVGAGPIAQQDSPAVCDRNVANFTNAFNSGIEQVPAFVRARTSDSTVHLAVEGSNGGDFTLVTNDESQVTDSSAGEPDSPSVRVVVEDCRAFRNITDSRTPGDQFRTEYANDRIRFVGVGTVNWLFFTAIETATDPISLAVVLFLFLVLLVVAYMIVRRATSVVRGGPVDNRSDDESDGDAAGTDDAGGAGGGDAGGTGGGNAGDGGASGGPGDTGGGGER